MVLLFASNCRQARFSGGQGPGLLETRGRADLCQRRRARQRFASVLADPPGGQNRSAPPGPAAAARRRHRRTDRQMAGSERSRLQKSSHSAHSRSVIPLAAARDRSRLPVSSVNASSMARLDRPRAWRLRPPAVRASRVRAPKAQPVRFGDEGLGRDRELAAPNRAPRLPPSSLCPADNRCGRPPSRPRLRSDAGPLDITLPLGVA